MPYVRFVRFIATGVASVGLSALIATVATQPSAQQQDAGGTDTQAASTTYPTNAAKIFRWGNAEWSDGFVGPLNPMWRVNRPSLVRNQHGMLTLDARGTTGTVAATAIGQNRTYGRWEARVRGRQYSTSGTPYRLVWELIPRTGGYHCGARSIVLSDYALGSDLATMHVRNAPDVDLTTSKALPLTDNEFHTYAIEVTPDHVSWFVDTRVVMTERRPAALTGAPYAVRFRVVGTPGARMNRGRMQMDWVRYYTLARRNAQSIEAPQATMAQYDGAC